MFLIIFFIKLSIIFILSCFDCDWFKFLPIILPVILSIAFLTVYERKILSAMQKRRGPNVIGYLGFYKHLQMG